MICRYVKNLETGYEMIWNNFLEGKKPKHMYVRPERSTFASEIYKEGIDAEWMFSTASDNFPKAPGLASADRGIGVNGMKLLGLHDFRGHMFGLLEELERTVSKSIKQNQNQIADSPKQEIHTHLASAAEAAARVKSRMSTGEKCMHGENSEDSTCVRPKGPTNAGQQGLSKGANIIDGVDSEQGTTVPLIVQTSRGKQKS